MCFWKAASVFLNLTKRICQWFRIMQFDLKLYPVYNYIGYSMMIVIKALFCHKLCQNYINYCTTKGILGFDVGHYCVLKNRFVIFCFNSTFNFLNYGISIWLVHRVNGIKIYFNISFKFWYIVRVIKFN